MATQAPHIEPLGPCLGAEVTGADLTSTDPTLAAQLAQALADHQVLIFRDQPALTPAQQIAFGAQFGPLHRHPAAPADAEHPELFVIHATAESKVANGNGWHTDVSCDAEPPAATLLQLHQLPDKGGDTLFASMFAAYEQLSPTLQAFLEGLTAHHASEHIYRGRYADRGVDDTGVTYPAHDHPVIRTHPLNRRRSLYVNPSFTTHINQLRDAESRALLDCLYRHQQRPEFQLRLQWQPNTVAFWDNRSAQHFALWDYWPQERRGHRVTIGGEQPFFDASQAPQIARPMRLASRL